LGNILIKRSIWIALKVKVPKSLPKSSLIQANFSIFVTINSKKKKLLTTNYSLALLAQKIIKLMTKRIIMRMKKNTTVILKWI